MSKIVNAIKKDYNGVKMAIKLLTKDKCPDWAILLYYVMFVTLTWPLLIVIWVGFKIWIKWLTYKLEKMERA